MNANQVFEQMKAAVAEMKIHHQEIMMPMRHVENRLVEFANGVTAYMSEQGSGYAAYRFGANRAIVRDAWRNGDFKRAIEELNEAWTSSGQNAKGVAALYDGQIVSIMKNYNAVPHAFIIDAIEKALLQPSVSGFVLDENKLVVYLAVRAHSQHLVSLKITNGHSGLVPLFYSATFKIGDFDFDIPLDARRRHLSKVEETSNDLLALMETAGQVRIDEELKHLDPDDELKRLLTAIDPLTNRQAKIIDFVSAIPMEDGLDLVYHVSKYIDRKGYRSSAEGILREIIENVAAIPSA